MHREAEEEEEDEGQRVRQQIAVGGEAAESLVIICFPEKWNVVITAVIKGARRRFTADQVNLHPASLSNSMTGNAQSDLPLEGACLQMSTF